VVAGFDAQVVVVALLDGDEFAFGIVPTLSALSKGERRRVASLGATMTPSMRVLKPTVESST